MTASKLSTVTRSDGTRQVSYGGHPLYRFAGDSGSGMATGQGLSSYGGTWYVVSPSGSAVTSRAPATTAPAGGSGY